MIRPMKKLQLIIHKDDRERILDQLQDLGVVHVTTKKILKMGNLEGNLDQLKSALAALTAFKNAWKPNLPADTYPGTPLELAKAYSDLEVKFKTFMDQRSEKLREVDILKPFGDFDPELIKNLGKHRIRITLCSVARNFYVKLPREAALVKYIKEWDGGIYFAVITHQQDRVTEDVQKLLSCETAVPQKSLRTLEKEIISLEKDLDLVNRERIEMTRFLDWLETEVQKESDQVLRQVSSQSLEEGAGGTVLVLQGFFPKEDESTLKRKLTQLPLVSLVTDPEHHDDVPVSLKNDPFTRLFEPIMKIFSLPIYRELDTTPFFAPFYTLFFGLCLADVGYGVILFVGAVAGLLFLRKSNLRPYLLLGVIFSISVIFSGIILNDYFGLKVGEGEVGQAFPSSTGATLSSIAWFKQQNDAMLLPLLLGVIQVLFGLVLRVINQVKHLGPLGALQPIGTISLFFGTLVATLPLLGTQFSIGPVPVGYWFSLFLPGVGYGFIGVGLALILLFNGLENGTKIWLRPLTGLWKLYELVTGMPGDILSYLRLFALGLAGGLLAEAVNNIALMLASGSGVVHYLAMVAVLIIGHGLNLGIGLLYAFVHSLRLTFVEFYKAIEFTGGGLEYHPLKRTKEIKQIPPALEPHRGEK